MTDAVTLRRGWTTGTCATAATKAALMGLWGGDVPGRVSIILPKGEKPEFEVVGARSSCNEAEAGIIKDAGDDPDVTHGAEVSVTVRPSAGGVVFRAGAGVGTVTKPGLPIDVGEPAINPVPRKMMEEEVVALAVAHDRAPDIEITVSVIGGAELALKTWNPPLGIEGGLSILGTTGVVRPFSCAAWIASIHRGIDVARASGLPHVAGCTGATSERIVQGVHCLPDHAMLDMGDFAGGLLKYLRRHPVPRLTIGGGIGKMCKLAQGAMDLHSGRSHVDLGALSSLVGQDLTDCNTALEAYTRVGPDLAEAVARRGLDQIKITLQGADIKVDTIVIDRKGTIIGRAE